MLPRPVWSLSLPVHTAELTLFMMSSIIHYVEKQISLHRGSDFDSPFTKKSQFQWTLPLVGNSRIYTVSVREGCGCIESRIDAHLSLRTIDRKEEFTQKVGRVG